MELKAGGRLADEQGTIELVVIRAPEGEVDFVFDHETEAPGPENVVTLGKRYVDEETDAEFLCSKPGDGLLVLNGRVMAIKQAKPLPSSD
jgi:hypothetical protein